MKKRRSGKKIQEKKKLNTSTSSQIPMPQKSAEAVTFIPRAVSMQKIEIQKGLDKKFSFSTLYI